ncbi:GTPase IMAP family member 4-like [Salmo trutta]|uniref:GTPase IMAP family member 4-like n=1 Tax=Salmo trutta TaxID=8032 RepID=A0A673Z795_SALTR|nr:GTPase IMAP family member 4-like [Salmo trutta]
MGKNDAGNTIMGQNHFSWFNTRLKKTHIKKENQIQNRHITLVRTPGSFSHLDSSSNPIKTDTIHCVQSLFSPGPHAILVIQLPLSPEDSKLITTTGKEMNTLFTQDVWKHTLVVFTRGEKLQSGHTIQDYISGHGLTELVKRCRKEPFVLYSTKKVKNQSIELIKTVEEMVAEKEDIYFMTQDKNMDPQGSQDAKIIILEKLYSKVDFLEKYTNTLTRQMELTKSQAKLKSYESTIKMKNDEIKRLREIIRNKDILLESLVAGVGQTNSQTECPACQQKDQQIQHLEEENNRYRAELSTLKNITDDVSEKYTPELEDHRRQPFLTAEAGRNHQNKTPCCIEMKRLSSCGFITKHRMALETRLGLLQPILMYLHHQKVLNDEDSPRARPNRTKPCWTWLCGREITLKSSSTRY